MIYVQQLASDLFMYGAILYDCLSPGVAGLSASSMLLYCMRV